MADLDGARAFFEGVLGFTPKRILPTAVLFRAGEGSFFAVSRSAGKASGNHTEGSVAQMGPNRAARFKDPEGNFLGLIEFATT